MNKSGLRLIILLCLLFCPQLARAEEEPTETSESSSDVITTNPAPDSGQPPFAPKKAKPKPKRKYLTDVVDRSDAGVFHVGAAIGGNMYIEPLLDSSTLLASGDYSRDFGFQVGVYFDYDYSELEPNIPLALRGMIGYKYILSSVHVFAFDGVVRRMFRLSEKTSLGLGGGVSAAVWYRAKTDTSPVSETLFLPSAVLTAGFDFNPFMVDLKWLINRFGSDSTIMGWELYLGVRL